MVPLVASRIRSLLLLIATSFALLARAEVDPEQVDVLISVAEQKMMLVQDGGWVKKYKISTSRFGVGDGFGSYKTPLGRLRIYEKLGDHLAAGAVLKHRQATGEVLAVNAPGRDPIVSRILWLEGLEAQNDNARGRGIYIHGTPEEARLGRPVSYGCIRMRSVDVIELYEALPVGATVAITGEALPRLPKWKPAPPPPAIILAARAPVPPTSKKQPESKAPATEAKQFPAVRVTSPPPKLPATIASAALVTPKELFTLRDSKPAAEKEKVPLASQSTFSAFSGSILLSGLGDPSLSSSRAEQRGPTLTTSTRVDDHFELLIPPSKVSEASSTGATALASATAMTPASKNTRPSFRHGPAAIEVQGLPESESESGELFGAGVESVLP